MAKHPKTSREGKRYREKNPDHPVARFCAEVVRRAGGNAADIAREIGVSRGAVSQWLKGNSHPSADHLITLSLQKGLSLGFISTLAAEDTGKKSPLEGDFEARLRILPDFLQESVIEVLARNETIAERMTPDNLKDIK